MKKLLLSLLLAIFVGIQSFAVPAYNKPVKILQLDGSYITIVGHGDEYRNYVTTLDGYTIVRGADRLYHYALAAGDKLVPSAVVAHDEAERTAEELQFLSSQEKNLKPQSVSRMPRLAPMESEKVEGVEYTEDIPWLAKPHKAINKKSYRGLVILAEFNDCKFLRGESETKNIFTSLMNGRNVTSYYDSYYKKDHEVTGSVRDYFYDNSYGLFDPQFDVVGPVTLPYSMYSPCKHDSTLVLANAVIDLVDSQVDFTKYDADGDGVVDMFYIIYAGHSSNYGGNDERLIWPHAFTLYEQRGNYYYDVKKDNIKLGRFACSAELYGWTDNNDCQIAGIGTVCHEFSHVLGYADHYDVEYGGHEEPGKWDVMSGGGYNGDYGYCPAGYTAYERYTAGFFTPTVLTASDHESVFSIPALENKAKAYRINTKASKKEYFLLENRQPVKWDKELPGSGMLVWRVDSTNTTIWREHQVNATSQLGMKLIRANGWTASTSDSKADAFPGSKGVTRLSNATTPANLLSHNNAKSPVTLKSISVSGGEVSFEVVDPNIDISKPEGSLFYESFNDCSGTGGNDGSFANNVATSSLLTDNEGWTTFKPYGGSECARFGNNVQRGYCITPSITLEEGKEYTLTFMAAPYYTDPAALTVSISSGDGVIANDSDAGSAPATSVALTTKTGEWSNFSLTLSGSGEQKIQFKGSTTKAFRFFLDEVLVKEKTATGIREVQAVENRKSANNTSAYNLAGQKVSNNYKGIVIKNGKRVVNK